MSKKEESAGGGIGILGALFLIFLTLKLCGVIPWSWWWITAPLWGGLVFAACVMAVVGIIAGIAWLCGK